MTRLNTPKMHSYANIFIALIYQQISEKSNTFLGAWERAASLIRSAARRLMLVPTLLLQRLMFNPQGHEPLLE